jgi:hypothetical protein
VRAFKSACFLNRPKLWAQEYIFCALLWVFFLSKYKLHIILYVKKNFFQRITTKKYMLQSKNAAPNLLNWCATCMYHNITGKQAYSSHSVPVGSALAKMNSTLPSSVKLINFQHIVVAVRRHPRWAQ